VFLGGGNLFFGHQCVFWAATITTIQAHYNHNATVSSTTILEPNTIKPRQRITGGTVIFFLFLRSKS
jgi:hypothetical protein